MADGSAGGAEGVLSETHPEVRSVTIVVCASCRFPGEPDASPRPGLLLSQATQEAAASRGTKVKPVACLGNCKRGLSAALLRDGSWSYVFGDLTIDSADDLIAGAEVFAASPDTLLPFRARPEALKRGLIARIPPIETLEDLPT